MLAMSCENCLTSPQRHSCLITDTAGPSGSLSDTHNLLSQLDNLLAVFKQWMCIIYLPHKICCSFVLQCNFFTHSIITLTALCVLFKCENKYVILQLLLMFIHVKMCYRNIHSFIFFLKSFVTQNLV